MAEQEDGKKGMDAKTQIKYLKAGIKDERKKNAKLQEEIAEITTRLNRAEEELRERTSREGGSEKASSSAKDKELIASLQNELQKAQTDLEEYKSKNTLLQTTVEQLKEEQTQLMTQYTGRIQELCERVADMGEKEKEKDRTILEYKKLLESSANKTKVNKKTSNETTMLREEMERYMKECELLSEKLEQTQVDQELLNEHNKKVKEDLSQQIIKLEEELKNKEEGIRKKEGEMTSMKSAVAEHKAIAHSLNEDNKAKVKEVEKIKTEMQKCEERMKKMKEEFNEGKKKVKELSNEKTEMEEKIKNYENEIEELKKTINNNSNEMKETKHKLWETESDKSKAEESARTLESTLAEKEEKLETALKELEKYKEFEKTMKEKEETILSLSADIDKYRKEIEDYKQIISENEAKIKELQEKVQAGEVAGETLKKEYEKEINCNNRKSASEDYVVKLKEEIEKLTQTVKDKDSEIVKMTSEAQYLKKEKEELAEIVKGKDGEIATHKTTNTALTQEINKLKEEFNKTKENWTAQLKNKESDLTKEKAITEGLMKELQKVEYEYKKDKDNLTTSVNNKEAELASLKSVNQSLSQKLKSAQDISAREKEEFTTLLESKETELAQVKDNSKGLSIELQQTKERLHKELDANNKLKLDLDIAMSNKANLESDIKNKTTFLNQKLEEIAQYQSQNKKLNEQLMKLEQELEVARNQVSIQQSSQKPEINETKEKMVSAGIVERLQKELSESKEKVYKVQNELEQKKNEINDQFMVASKTKGEKVKLEIELKIKEESVTALTAQNTSLNQQVASLTETVRKYEHEKASIPYEDIQADLKKKDILLAGYHEDILTKTAQIKELNENIMALQAKLMEGKPGLEISEKFYPATEIRQKVKVFVNIRFVKAQTGEYMLEIWSLKEKRAYYLKMVQVHLHEAKKNCLIIKVKGKVDRIEIYETEYAASIHENYGKFVAEGSSKPF